MIQDDHSTPDGAAQAAQAEIGAGAELILGPVYADDVRQAASVAKAGRQADDRLLDRRQRGLAGRLSAVVSDRGLCRPDRPVRRVARQEVLRRDGAAERLRQCRPRAVPADRRAAQHAGRRHRPLCRRADAQSAAQQVAAVGGQIDALFIPEQADGMPAVATRSRRTESRRSSSAPASGTTPAFCGCRSCRAPGSPRPTMPASTRFAQRYKAKFGAEPTRLATLSYDAVTLAAALARNAGPDRYGPAALTSVSGFNGADGVFRFRADGTNERGLAVMEIDNNAATRSAPRRAASPPASCPATALASTSCSRMGRSVPVRACSAARGPADGGRRRRSGC